MKKTLIFFLILVCMITLVLMCPIIVLEHTVTEDEISEYKNSILNTNGELSEETLNEMTNTYIKKNTKEKGIEKGIPFIDSLKMAIILSSIISVFYILKNLSN